MKLSLLILGSQWAFLLSAQGFRVQDLGFRIAGYYGFRAEEFEFRQSPVNSPTTSYNPSGTQRRCEAFLMVPLYILSLRFLA